MTTYLVLADHDLFDQFTSSELHQIRSLKRTRDLTASDKRQTLDTFEIRMLNHHEAFLRQKGLRIIVDKLSVDEAVNAVRRNGFNFCFHFFLDGQLKVYRSI